MSVVNFIQTIWSEKIQRDLEESCKLVKDCTRKYEGDCEYAKTVKILGIGDPTVAPYVGQDINIEEMTDKGQDLVIDVQNYFAFEVKDVDKAQSVPGLPAHHAVSRQPVYLLENNNCRLCGRPVTSIHIKCRNLCIDL